VDLVVGWVGEYRLRSRVGECRLGGWVSEWRLGE